MQNDVNLLYGVLGFGCVPWLFYYAIRKALENYRKNEARSALSDEVSCPMCGGRLSIDGMLDASVFNVPGAIAFDCSHCHDRVYFAPYEDFIETGLLGSSPVEDIFPQGKFSYPTGFDMRHELNKGVLTVTINEKKWDIPRYAPSLIAGKPGPDTPPRRWN